jgi:hypothetical protein
MANDKVTREASEASEGGPAAIVAGEGTLGRPENRPTPSTGTSTGSTGTSTGSTGTSTGTATGAGGLLSREECDKLGLQLQHAVGDFVDEPRAAVEEADHVLEEVAGRFTEAVTQRRRTLRASWQATDTTAMDTEQLRLALRDYRELTERLLRT